MSVSLSPRKPLDVGHFGINSEQLPPIDAGAVDMRNWFSDTSCANPLELEIGSGKGTFLCQQASLTPNVNYIGVEYAKAFWRHAADRCRRRGLENIRIVHGEAGSFVRYRVADASLRCVHIYFPDPWPKKRHHKRRLVQAPFLTLLHQKLETDGRIRIVTDHAQYYEWMTQHIQQVESKFEQLPFHPADGANDGELTGTNFERKYRCEGRPFYSTILCKRSHDHAGPIHHTTGSLAV